MRFVSIFILGLFIFGCSLKDEPRTESVFPVVASTAKPQETPSPELELECQNVVGTLGFADISFDASTVIRFYAKPDTSEQPAQTLRFYDDTVLKMFSFRAEGGKSYSLLRPEVHKLDYFLFDLAVKSWRKGWLEVVVDDQTNETLWVQESKVVRFEDWLQNMKNSFAIGRLIPENNPVRVKPDATAKEINFSGRGCFKVEQMQGDWIRVVEQSHCSDTPNQSVSGWLRWRDESGCLLVEIFPFA